MSATTFLRHRNYAGDTCKNEEFPVATFGKTVCIFRYLGVAKNSVKYGNAVVFSPALDKYLLIAKIHEGMPLENLTKYSSDEYIVQLKQLHEEIQRECYGKYEMPDELYKFLDKILEEDSNG